MAEAIFLPPADPKNLRAGIRSAVRSLLDDQPDPVGDYAVWQAAEIIVEKTDLRLLCGDETSLRQILTEADRKAAAADHDPEALARLADSAADRILNHIDGLRAEIGAEWRVS